MRRIVILLSLAATLFVLAGMSVCQRVALVNCEYDFAGVEPNIDLSDPLDPKVTIDAGIQIKNLNDIAVIVDRIDMDFLANEKIIFNGTPAPGDTIAEGITDTITISMDIDYALLGETLLEAIQEGSATYELKGTIFLETEFASDSFPITIKKGQI